MKKQLVEFIGTFLFVLSIWLIVKSGTALAPLAIGWALAVLVYVSGHLSWWHLNPAVTVWLILRGKISTWDAVSYIAAQLAGAILAWVVVSLLVGSIWNGVVSGNNLQIVVAEALFTFLLVYTVCSTATSTGTSGNNFYGWAIGMAVATGAFAVGGISGWAFNPAVAIGGLFDGTFALSQIVFHLIGQFWWAALAALTYNYIDSK